MGLDVGAIVAGKVTHIKDFGAFVALDGGKSGLVHVSEIANAYVQNVKDYLQEGQEVTVRVIGIDASGRIRLSIKKALEPAARPAQRTPRSGGDASAAGKANPDSFEEKLKQFMQESNAKFSESALYTKSTSRRK